MSHWKYANKTLFEKIDKKRKNLNYIVNKILKFMG